MYANNPSRIVPLSVSAAYSTPEFLEELGAVFSVMLPHFCKESPEQWSLHKITGGITNALYKVTSACGSQTVVVRIYGRGTESFIDRGCENLIFADLSKKKMGPEFIGLFQNGRIEGYIESRSLEPAEMYDERFIPLIAKALASYHTVKVHDLSTAASGWRCIGNFNMLTSRMDTKAHPRAAEFNEIRNLCIESECTWLQEYLRYTQLQCEREANPLNAGKSFAFDVTFTHNDLLSGNMLYTKDDKVILIDYEYAGYNIRAWDIANHFCEYSGFEYEVGDRMPEKAQRMIFLHTYVSAIMAQKQVEDDLLAQAREKGVYLEPTNNTVSDELMAIAQNKQFYADFLQGFDEVVVLYTLCADLYWGTWAVYQAGTSTIDFDYLTYAKLRFDTYFMFKKLLVP